MRQPPKGKMYETIKVALETHPILRQNVNYLATYIWKLQCEVLNIVEADKFFEAIQNGSLWNYQTICRQRRYVLRDCPHLKATQEVIDKTLLKVLIFK